MLKQRSKRTVISQFNGSELKEWRERNVISQRNSNELKSAISVVTEIIFKDLCYDSDSGDQ